jgi:hypothetical protein
MNREPRDSLSCGSIAPRRTCAIISGRRLSHADRLGVEWATSKPARESIASSNRCGAVSRAPESPVSSAASPANRCASEMPDSSAGWRYRGRDSAGDSAGCHTLDGADPGAHRQVAIPPVRRSPEHEGSSSHAAMVIIRGGRLTRSTSQATEANVTNVPARRTPVGPSV